jgi:hypothetical protein
MKKITLLFLCIPFSLPAFVQPEKELDRILAQKNFTAFKSYCDSIGNSKSNNRSHWEYVRDIAPGFKEGINYLEKSIPDKFNKNVSTVYTFRTRMFIQGDKIIYYEFAEKKN